MPTARLLVITGPVTEPAVDTTLALIRAATDAGHHVDICDSADLGWSGGAVVAHARPVLAAHELRLGPGTVIKVAEADAVLYRRDPPFGTTELHATLLLELVREHVRFLSDPRALRDANEKLYALRFPELIPDTAVLRDPAAVRDFAAACGGDAVVKPLDGCGGTGVFRLRLDDTNAGVIAETATAEGRRATIVQRYLPAAATGDKRILLLDGDVLGAFLRVPRSGEGRCNLHRGGTAVATALTERERHIARVVGARCRRDGLGLVGLDVIGEHLTEINVTSPTGLRELERLEQGAPAAAVIRWLAPYGRALRIAA